MKVFMLDPSKYTPPYDYGLCNALSKRVDLTLFTSEFVHGDEIPGKQYHENKCYFKLTNAFFAHGKGVLRPLFKGLEYVVDAFLFLIIAIIRRPDIVHYQWLVVWNIDYLTIKLLRRLGIKIVFTAHNIFPHDSGEFHQNKYKKAYEIVDAVIVHTNDALEDLVRLFPEVREKCSVIAHGDFSYLRQYAPKMVSELECIAGRDVIMMFGLVRPYKNVELAIEAMPAILKGRPNAILVIVGKADNGYEQRIREIISSAGLDDNALYINKYLSDSELVSYLQYANLVIFPYKKITQSGAFLAACDLHLPILASDLPAFKQIIVDKVTGMLFQEGDVGSYVEKTKVFFNEGLEQEIRQNIKEKIEEGKERSWDDIANKTDALYRKLIAH